MHVSTIAIFITVALTVPAFAEKCKAPHLRQGMPYAAARKAVLKAGFQTPTPPAYGYSKNDQKVISECSGDVAVCNEYPEIDSCSGQGQCNMVFIDIYRNSLSIVTSGDGPSGATVTAFKIICAK